MVGMGSEELRIGVDEVIAHFDKLEDPRSTINLRHPLVSVIVVAIMAVMAGASGPTSIAEWAVLKEELLLKLLLLPNVESQETCGDTNLYSQNASASESSEKQCSSSFPYWPAGISVLVVFGEDCTPTGCANARVENGDRHRGRSQSPFSTAGCPKAHSQLGWRPKNLHGGDGEFAGTPHIFPESEPVGSRGHPSG